MFDEFETIHRYTRKQAIEDGMLVDLMQGEMAALVAESGFKLPIAMTSAAFSQTVVPIGGELPECQDLKGRLWDVLSVLRYAIKRIPPNEDRVFFKVSVFDGSKLNEVSLWALCGPGDAGEPVITIMLEGED